METENEKRAEKAEKTRANGPFVLALLEHRCRT